jgi:hypothetical protein
MPKKKKRSKAEMGKIRSKAFLKWRKEKEPGAIMKPETFQGIVRKNVKKVGIKRAKKIAGGAYWKTAKAKYRSKALAGRMKNA